MIYQTKNDILKRRSLFSNRQLDKHIGKLGDLCEKVFNIINKLILRKSTRKIHEKQILLCSLLQVQKEQNQCFILQIKQALHNRFSTGLNHLQLFKDIYERQNKKQYSVFFNFQKNYQRQLVFQNIWRVNIFTISLQIHNFIVDMNHQLEYCQLDLQNAEEMLQTTMDANRGVYPLWKHNIITEEQFRDSTRKAIIFFFQMQEKYRQILNKPLRCSAGMRLNGKLVAVGLSIDLFEQREIYKRIAEDNTNPIQFYAKLFNTLDLKGLKPGYAVYHGRWSVLPELHRQGIAVRFAYEGCKASLTRGYQYSYSFTSVDNSLHILTRMGGEVIASAEYVGNGFKFTVNLLKLDLKKFVDTYEKFLKKNLAPRL